MAEQTTQVQTDQAHGLGFGFVTFLVFSFLVTCFAGLLVLASGQSLAYGGALPPAHPIPLAGWQAAALLVVAATGPAIGALIASAEDGGRRGVRILIGRAANWRTSIGWYAIGLVGPVLVGLVALALSAVLTTRHPVGLFARVAPLQLTAIAAAALAEEVGWRGYAVPVLQKRFGALGAGALVGAIWFAWRNWKLATPNAMEFLAPLSVVMILVFFISASILITWLYNSSGGSVPVAWAANAGLALMSTVLHIGFVQYALIVAIFCIGAALVLMTNSPRTLTRL